MDRQQDERPDPELLLKQNFPRESDKRQGDGLKYSSDIPPE